MNIPIVELFWSILYSYLEHGILVHVILVYVIRWTLFFAVTGSYNFYFILFFLLFVLRF